MKNYILTAYKIAKKFAPYLIILVLELYFFRFFFLRGDLLGEFADGLFNNMVMEHWFKFFKGLEPIAELPIFYPLKGTLGYSDILFGYSIPYSILRLFGLDLFRSAAFTVIGAHLAGTLAFFHLLHKRWNLSLLPALTATLLACFSNALFIHSTNTQQLLCMTCISFPLLFIDYYYKNLESKTRYLWGALTTLSIVLFLYTSFYIGFFCMLFLAIFGVVAQCFNWGKFGKYLPEFGCYLLLFLLILIPFFMLYLPISAKFEKWKWDLILAQLPAWYNYFTPFIQNNLWGSLALKMHPDMFLQLFSNELYATFTPLSFLLFLFSGIFILLQKKNKILKMTVIAILLSFILVLKIGDASLWYYLYRYIIGFSAIRSVARYLMFLTIPAAILSGIYLQQLWNRSEKLKFRTILFLLIFFILLADNSCYAKFEDGNEDPFSKNWNVSYMLHFYNEIPMPPSDAKIFYPIHAPICIDRRIRLVESNLIAEKYQLKSLLGYSGKNITSLVYIKINENGYLNLIRDWKFRHKLQNLYAYSMQEKRWYKNLELNMFPKYNIGEIADFSKISQEKFSSIITLQWQDWNGQRIKNYTDSLGIILDCSSSPENCNLKFKIAGKLPLELYINGIKAANYEIDGMKSYAIPIKKEYLINGNALFVEFVKPDGDYRYKDYRFQEAKDWSLELYQIGVTR